VPELEYFVTHKDEEGRPAPRGEILYRGAIPFPGYYKDEVQTAKAIDKDGWLHSGDIGMLLPGRANAMKVIDRRGNFMKLNNTKFVILDRLEQSYKNCEGIRNVWIYGSGLHGFILAVCNVYEDKYLEIAKRVGLDFDGDFEKALGSEEAQKAFLETLQKNVQTANKMIMDFEVVKGIIIEPENFMTLGMYTESGKMKRRALATRYQEKLDALYKKLD
jgi:long-chain acyl-CoA synthetase